MKKSWIHGGTVLARIGPHHLAFLRGYLEGLDLALLSRRYLETSVVPDPELRVAKSTLKWIREQLLLAARRRGHFPEARLILIDPEKLRARAKRAVPSLEEFREERDPHELYSESELIELFEEEYGGNVQGDRRTSRNERLRRRQLAALSELEKLLGAPPAVQDDVAGWLDVRLASRLKTVGITSLGELVAAINGRGYRWWTRVPRLGEKAAAQIVAWLRTESVEQALGLKLQIQATVKAGKLQPSLLASNRGRQTGIVPLEHLVLPASLDGSLGQNRGEARGLQAANDLQAIQAWLSRLPSGSSTWRSYRKEAERFLLWAVIERQLPLSSLTGLDCERYCDFLEKLDASVHPHWPFRTPRDAWFAPRGTKRWSHLWRPFEGSLSPESRKLAVTVLTLLGRWLVEQGYWRSNPWQEISLQRTPTERDAKPVRSLNITQWVLLWDFLATLPEGPKKERIHFVLKLCQSSGLRLSQLAHAQCAHLKSEKSTDGVSVKCLLSVPANDGYREVALHPAVIDALDRYLAHRGLGGWRDCEPSTYLIGRLPGTRAPAGKGGPEVSPSALHQILKRFLSDAADFFEKQQSMHATAVTNSELEMAKATAGFRAASSHWLRSSQLP